MCSMELLLESFEKSFIIKSYIYPEPLKKTIFDIVIIIEKIINSLKPTV